MRRWLWVVLAVALVSFWGRHVVRDFVTKGRRLTTTTLGDGYVEASPDELAAAAAAVVGRPVSVDAYALARMVRSEAGSGSVRARQAVAWVAINDAGERWSLLYTLTVNNRRPANKFGQQLGGRYATSRDPYENDLAIAEAVLAREVSDPTGGATKFVHRGAFGKQEGTGSYESVVQRWGREGYQPLELGDVGDLVVFRRVA